MSSLTVQIRTNGNKLAVTVTPELVTIMKANPIHPEHTIYMNITHEDLQAVVATVATLKESTDD